MQTTVRVPYDALGDPCNSDEDGDGFSDEREALFLGTDPTNGCAVTSTRDDEEPDPQPVDFDNDQIVTIPDLLQLTPPVFRSMAGDPSYSQRKDLNADGSINILDFLLLTPPVFNTSCVP